VEIIIMITIMIVVEQDDLQPGDRFVPAAMGEMATVPQIIIHHPEAAAVAEELSKPSWPDVVVGQHLQTPKWNGRFQSVHEIWGME
jgi:hypothetical protein